MTVLIVEDDLELANGLSGALAQSGYETEVAHRGHEALAALAARSHRLVILDLCLPDCDGIDVLRHLRRKGSEVPVLILTARDDLDDRILGLDAGADDYLSKPFELGELEARVRALLRRRHALDGKLRHGTIALDPVAHVATLNDRELDLTGREFAVLELLMRRPKGIVSKRQMLDSLYDFGDDVSPSVIESFISRLRGKLADAGGGVRIRVVRGLGYRLETDADE